MKAQRAGPSVHLTNFQLGKRSSVYLLIVVDDVREIVQLDGGLKAEHGLALERECFPSQPPSLLQLCGLACLRP